MHDDNGRLLAAAAGGDQGAWDELVRRYNALLWSIAISYRLQAGDDADAVQNTWLRLVEHLDRITEPERLGSWLATTVRRECLQLLRRRSRPGDVLMSEDPPDLADDRPALDATLLRDERDAALWQAFHRLGQRCQQLLRVLMASPPPSYGEVAAALDMAVGSIGPTRQRCLGQLRGIVGADAVLDRAALELEGPS